MPSQQKRLYLFTVGFIVTAVISATIVFLVQNQRALISAQETTERRGTIRWHAQQARARGQQSVRIPAPRIRPVGAADLNHALSRFTVVIATPIESRSYIIDPYMLVTWHKFRVVETLTQRPVPECPSCPQLMTPPDELLPLNENEILLPRPSGTVIIDGVSVTASEGGFPPFLPSQRYLLFIDLDASRRIGRLSMGRYGVFTVSADGSIRHINNQNHPFRNEIETGDGNALEQLRMRVRNR